MKLIKPAFKIIEQQAGLEGIYKMIELAGRVCHKSEDKITETSTKEFVERMLKMKHLSTCEFGTVYLEFHVKDPSVVGGDEYHNQQAFLNKLINKYVKSDKKHDWYYLRNKIYNNLINLGYSKEIVISILNNYN